MSTHTLSHALTQSQLVVHPEAGCVASSWRVRGREILALPLPLAEFLKSTKTGGIPLLYPYANRLRCDQFLAAGKQVNLSQDATLKRDGNGFPMHGLLLRFADWTMHQASEEQLEASIRWSDHAALFTAYPFAHTLRVHWKLGQLAAASTLTVTTCIEADCATDVPVAFGWHPYFNLHDRANAQLQLPKRQAVPLAKNGLPLLNAPASPWLLADRTCASGAADDLFQLDVDYATAADSHAAIIEQHQQLQLQFERGYAFMQIYSPADAAFVCVEPMVAKTSSLCDHARVVRAGDTFTTTFQMSVS